MKVDDIFTIRSRGPVILVRLDGPSPEAGSKLRRTDGVEWTVRGVERTNRLPVAGEMAAILIDADASPSLGDEVERVGDA